MIDHPRMYTYYRNVAGRPYGVFVNNRHKYRIANNLKLNIQSDHGAAYDNRRHGTSDLTVPFGWTECGEMEDTTAMIQLHSIM